MDSNDPNSALVNSTLTPVCRFCGIGRHNPEACPRVSMIEYEPAGSTCIKKVGFHSVKGVVRARGPSW